MIGELEKHYADEGIYIIRHRRQDDAYIMKAVFPPRLCEWTSNIHLAEQFIGEHEAEIAAEFISCNAYDVKVIKYD